MKGAGLYSTAASEEGMLAPLSHRIAARKHLSYNAALDYRVVWIILRTWSSDKDIFLDLFFPKPGLLIS